GREEDVELHAPGLAVVNAISSVHAVNVGLAKRGNLDSGFSKVRRCERRTQRFTGRRSYLLDGLSIREHACHQGNGANGDPGSDGMFYRQGVPPTRSLLLRKRCPSPA